MHFCKITDNIYRLKIPFDNIYTSVFLLAFNDKFALVDCATTTKDVDDYVIVALREMKLGLDDLNYIILTHNHGDHAGGLKRILELSPNIKIVKEERIIFGKFSTFSLAGHTSDCIGIFDQSSNTLISGDALQCAGVGKYPCSILDKDAYLKTIEKINSDERVENILFSHAYEPFYKDEILGRENVIQCLKICKNYI